MRTITVYMIPFIMEPILRYSYHCSFVKMALPAEPLVPANGTMHRRKSSKDEDGNVFVFPDSPPRSPPATAPLAQGFNLNGWAPGSKESLAAPSSSRSRVTSTPPAISVSQSSLLSQPASAGPYRTTFSGPQVPHMNGASPAGAYRSSHGRHQSVAMRQSFSLPAYNSHGRTRSISGPFSPITPSPLSASFPPQQLAMPPPNNMLPSSHTAPELHQPTSPVENGNGVSKPLPRRHSRIHSRNLSVYFPRPGSLPASTIAEDGAQELDFSTPPSDEGMLIPSASPGPGQRTFREGFTFGARPPSAPATQTTHPMPPMKHGSSEGGASRRGHHHKHSLSHNFFSFLEPGAQSPPTELHTQPTPVPVSPWAPISPFPSSQSMQSTQSMQSIQSTDGDKASANGHVTTASKANAKNAIGRIRAPAEVSPVMLGAAVWQFALGAWLWITGQQIGSLSCTGLGYWVVFDAFGVALGHILPNYLARPSMQSETRRPHGCVLLML